MKFSKSSQMFNTSLGMVAIIIWSTTVAFGRSLTEQIGPVTTAALIYLIGGVFGCGYLTLAKKIRRKFALNPRYLLGCGGLFIIYMSCIYLALGLAINRSQVLEVGLINYLWPMMTILAAIPALKMRATIFLIPGVISATAGVFLATTQNQPLFSESTLIAWQFFRRNLSQNSAPYILALSASVSWGLYSALSRKWAGAAEGGAVPIFMLATGVILGLTTLLTFERAHWTGRTVLELLYMAGAPNLAYVFWERAMRKGDLILVASCSYFTPFLSTLVSCVYLKVPAGMKLWFGCALIIVGAIICKLSVKEQKHK